MRRLCVLYSVIAIGVIVSSCSDRIIERGQPRVETIGGQELTLRTDEELAPRKISESHLPPELIARRVYVQNPDDGDFVYCGSSSGECATALAHDRARKERFSNNEPAGDGGGGGGGGEG